MRRRIPRILTEFTRRAGADRLCDLPVERGGRQSRELSSRHPRSSGALAFSAQETLAQSLGRHRDPAREDAAASATGCGSTTVTGQVVGIRWRYMAIATITNETIVIPNSTLMKNRFTVVARRGERAHTVAPACPVRSGVRSSRRRGSSRRWRRRWRKRRSRSSPRNRRRSSRARRSGRAASNTRWRTS